MTLQLLCANRFIHRRFHRRKEELQCPECGKKLICWNDEDHQAIEYGHRLSCVAIHPREVLTEHER